MILTPIQHALYLQIIFPCLAKLLLFDYWNCGNPYRQVVNPARPARTLTSLTRAVRRGQWLSCAASLELIFSVHGPDHALLVKSSNCLWFWSSKLIVQVEKIQALTLMEILMMSQQNCSILRGTQLRTPSRVLLQIACTCIMHRGTC